MSRTIEISQCHNTEHTQGADVIITDVRITSGAYNPGAILLAWNVSGDAGAGLWDVHLSCGSGPEGAGGFGVYGHGEVHTLLAMGTHGGGMPTHSVGWLNTGLTLVCTMRVVLGFA